MLKKIFMINCSLFISAALMLTGCWDENGEMEATPSGDYMRTADVVASGSSTQASIHIEANCQWSLTTNDSWLSLGANSGEGTTDVAVTMTQNPSTTDRTAIVTLKSAGGISTTLTVRQEKNQEQIVVTPTELEFAASDMGYQEFTVKANCHWNITGCPDWVTLSTTEGTNTSSVQVRVAENIQGDSRNPATLTITGDGGATATVIIRQQGQKIVVTPTELEFAASDTGYQEFTVTAKGHWTITGCPEWVTLSTTEGTNTSSVQVRVAENTQGKSRTPATLIITGDGGASAMVTIRQEGRNIVLAATPQLIKTTALGGTNTLAVTSNVTWHLSATDDWLTSFSTVNGTGAVELTFVCLANTTLRKRTGTINVTSEDKTHTVTVTVEQEAGTLPVLGPLTLTYYDEQQAMMVGNIKESLFEITEYGICYSEKTRPTTAETKVIVGRSAPVGDGSFEAQISGLTKGNTYHVRAYAVSAAGTAYSEELDFVALPMPKNDDNDRPAFARKK